MNMKYPLNLYLFFLIISTISVSAQRTTVADKFLNYLNNYKKKELATIITPNFKINRTFSKKITDKREFLGNYLEESESFIAKYKVISKSIQKNKSKYLVEDQSQYLKLLDVKFPKWNLTITTVTGKVSSVTLAPTDDYDTYIAELNSKIAKFNSWMQEDHPETDLEKIGIPEVLEYLHKYVESKGILMSNLQNYDETTGNVEIVSKTDNNAIFDNLTCVHRNKLNEVKRAAFYPFNKAKKVLLLSFNDKNWTFEYYVKTPKTINIDTARNVKQLSKIEINKLTDLCYNYGFKKLEFVKTIREEIACSELKNAIVFVDKDNKPFEYIVFSFDCDEVEFSSEKVSYGDECTTKRDLLKQFFIANGISTE